MNREWLTLAFGILLVLSVVVASVVNNMGWFTREAGAPLADTPSAATPSEPAAARPAPPSVPAAPPKPVEPEPKLRLDAAVPVVHKHRLGSCEGTLRASSAGVSYTTTDREDSFQLALSTIDQFDLADDRSNLRVRQRDGRTWNFTPRANDTNGLAAFHRQVERARRQIPR